MFSAKEGLSLINGTQLITCLGAEAVARAARLVEAADIIAALSLDALRGTMVIDMKTHNLDRKAKKKTYSIQIDVYVCIH